MIIRIATPEDFEHIWPIFQPIAQAGETYAYPADISKDQAYTYWMDTPHVTYVAEDNGVILGSYYLKANHPGPGSHVCNAGYMVSPDARGKGVGKTMCLHSQQEAIKHGYRAMQFNLVVSTNPAVELWKKLEFEVVGVLPGAFKHASLGYVDALVFFKQLVRD